MKILPLLQEIMCYVALHHWPSITGKEKPGAYEHSGDQVLDFVGGFDPDDDC